MCALTFNFAILSMMGIASFIFVLVSGRIQTSVFQIVSFYFSIVKAFKQHNDKIISKMVCVCIAHIATEFSSFKKCM